MAGEGSEDEDGGGLLTRHTKGIVQHFQKQERESTPMELTMICG